MKDVFYTILVIWILWRVFSSVNSYNSKRSRNNANNQQNRKPGETTIVESTISKKKMGDSAGDYVDFEELK